MVGVWALWGRRGGGAELGVGGGWRLGMGGVEVRELLGVRCGGVLGDGREAEGRLPLTPSKTAPYPKQNATPYPLNTLNTLQIHQIPTNPLQNQHKTHHPLHK